MANQGEPMKKLLVILLILVFVTVTAGCAEWRRTAKGGVIGAGAGGAVGAAVGYATGATGAGLLIGAAVGGTSGAVIGNIMDQQAAEIERDIQGAKVERIGEGIKITFNSGILFDVDKADLKPPSQIGEDIRLNLNENVRSNILTVRGWQVDRPHDRGASSRTHHIYFSNPTRAGGRPIRLTADYLGEPVAPWNHERSKDNTKLPVSIPRI
jgi:Glycine zipper